MNKLPVNHNAEWAPSLRVQEDRASHREWIGGRVLTVLSHYWREDDPVELTAAIGADWADVLEGLPRDAIQKACIQYQRDEPRRKPTPGAIYTLARSYVPRPQVVHQPEPDRHVDRVTAEAANEIVARAGYAPKRFNGDA